MPNPNTAVITWNSRPPLRFTTYVVAFSYIVLSTIAIIPTFWRLVLYHICRALSTQIAPLAIPLSGKMVDTWCVWCISASRQTRSSIAFLGNATNSCAVVQFVGLRVITNMSGKRARKPLAEASANRRKKPKESVAISPAETFTAISHQKLEHAGEPRVPERAML